MQNLCGFGTMKPMSKEWSENYSENRLQTRGDAWRSWTMVWLSRLGDVVAFPDRRRGVTPPTALREYALGTSPVNG
jgi:hypothetical protein